MRSSFLSTFLVVVAFGTTLVASAPVPEAARPPTVYPPPAPPANGASSHRTGGVIVNYPGNSTSDILHRPLSRDSLVDVDLIIIDNGQPGGTSQSGNAYGSSGGGDAVSGNANDANGGSATSTGSVIINTSGSSKFCLCLPFYHSDIFF